MGRTVHTARKSVGQKTVVKTDANGVHHTRLVEITLPKKTKIVKKERKPPRKSQTPNAIHQRRVKLDKKDTHVPRRAFDRLIREIAQDFNEDISRFTPDAISAIQNIAEIYVDFIFKGASLMTKHAKRKTTNVHDMRLFIAANGMAPINSFSANDIEMDEYAPNLKKYQEPQLIKRVQLKDKRKTKKLDTTMRKEKEAKPLPDRSDELEDDQPPELIAASHSDDEALMEPLDL